MEKLESIVTGTIFRNEENGYSVISVRQGRGEVTVTGIMPELTEGEQVRLTGDWQTHPQYGRQFRAETCEICLPTTLLGIERFLGSGLISGVGESMARKIVEEFGEETLEIMSEHPERLMEVNGIGRKTWPKIAESFRKQYGTRTAMVFLQEHGVPAGLAVKIAKQYGDDTARIVKENPYRMCEQIEGVGFLTADRIGMQMGIAADSEGRIQSALTYVLKDAAAGSGHIYLPKEELIRRTAQLLRADEAVCERELQQLALDQKVTMEVAPEGDGVRVYLPGFLTAEKEVAQLLVDLMTALGRTDAGNAAARVKEFERKNGICFGAQQREAILSALTHGVLVITGGPGTGKTTIINCILSLLKTGNNVLLAAPTGRAAKRMSEATGQEATTIHRMLGYSGNGDSGSFARNREKPLEAGCVIVDEMSMVDLLLMRSLLRAVAPGTRLILVGDADQLPSVGAGNVLGDILESGVVPQVRLTDIYRQNETSRIVLNAHRINHGEMPVLNEKGTDFFFERRDSMADATDAIVGLVSRRLPAFLKLKDAAEIMRQIQVLAPARKGECGVQTLNVRLQAVLNPPRQRPGEKPAQLTRGEHIFRPGDKVIQTRNDYELAWVRNGEGGAGVFNGDVGYIETVDTEESSLTVLFDDNRRVEYDSEAMQNLELAYCLSVHKSQGSEFPVVVIPVAGGPSMLLTRNLFYTALTRARSLVVLVGREEVIRQMVENDYILRRYTTLCERLRTMALLLNS